MTTADTLSVTVDRDLSWPPSKVWRALTQPHLIDEWLMKTDFEPVLGRKFQLSADWGTVDCRVTSIEAERSLAYTWTAFGVETVVTFTLTPTDAGTHLRVEQAGFSAAPEHRRFVAGAEQGWKGFFGKLDQVLASEI